MTLVSSIRRLSVDLIAAFAFLTRFPLPHIDYEPDSLARSARFFPLVGLFLGGMASLLHVLLMPHLNGYLVALMVLLALVLATGGLHEDGLADAADAFGGGLRDRSKILSILRDSRIGSYGALALIFSLATRLLLLASLPLAQFASYLIAAHVLCRWSAVLLSRMLQPAREKDDGQGVRIAKRTSIRTLIVASCLTLAIVLPALRFTSLIAIAVTIIVTSLSAAFYHSRLGGVTGDCFGATIQLVEISVLGCGVWIR
jgi:adenosylcobinamide-GDP ribazoletransferase